MGHRVTWMAVQNPDEAAVLDSLGLEVCEETDDFYGAPYTLAHLPDGWLLIVSGKQAPFDRLAPNAVPEGFVLTGFMSETVMVSEARGFRDGTPEWALIHDPDVDPRGVQIEGTLPTAFAEIYRQLQADQAQETEQVDHIFDAPIRLSTEICGFTPDYDMDVTWTALIKTKTGAAEKKGKGFFARLFGR